MKTIFLSMLSCTLVLGCFTQYPTYTRQPAVDYSTKYADKLEPSATLIMSGYLFTVEKTTDGKYIRKEFFPDTRQIIKFQTFADKELSVPEGLYKSWWDDGVQTSEGMYVNGKQNGDWTSWSEKNVSKGKYVNGKQEGLWIGIDSLGNKRSEINFAAGKRNGPFKDWDKTGELVREGTFLNDELESEKIYKEKENESQVYKVVEKKPRFSGCDNGTDQEIERCAETKLLQFIYSNIKYPAFARENGIQGTAYVRFVVDKDGSITNIKAIRGICGEIRDECERVVRLMPKWVPGQQGGEAVKVQFNLPIKFKLE